MSNKTSEIQTRYCRSRYILEEESGYFVVTLQGLYQVWEVWARYLYAASSYVI